MRGKGGSLEWERDGVKVKGEEDEDDIRPAGGSRRGTGAKGTPPVLEGAVAFEAMGAMEAMEAIEAAEAASSSGRKKDWTCACSAAGARGTTVAGPWLRCAMGKVGNDLTIDRHEIKPLCR